MRTLCSIALICCLAGTAPAETAPERDGQRDFDFIMGTWNVVVKTRLNPLTAAEPVWSEMKGTTNNKKIWGGKANMDEFEADGPRGHHQSMTIRLYNPQTKQWNLWWVSSRDGVMSPPPMAGGFKDGRGEFYDSEVFQGKAILVRDLWTDITPTSAHFEQAFSSDGGKTWEPNWIASYSRAGR